MNSKAAAAMLLALVVSSEVVAQHSNPPAFAYLLHCSGCHIEDGSGDPPEVPDLRTDLDLLLQSSAGRNYMMQVPGITDAPLSAQEMADLMNWMIGFLYPDLEDFEPFTADEVIAGRQTRLSDPLGYRRSLPFIEQPSK
jgi:cytochrome c peroxidase